MNYTAGQLKTNARKVHPLRARWMDPTVGRFTSFDDFEASLHNPTHLHKYNYGGGDPVNRNDPSGHDWSLTSAMVTGGIIGSVIGSGYGAYKGAHKAGTVLSWKTLEYGLAGAVVGFGVGAAAGALVYGAGAALTTAAKAMGPESWLYAMVVTAHTTPLPAFGLGVISGLALGVTDAVGARGVLTAGAASAGGAVTYAFNTLARDHWDAFPEFAQHYFFKVIGRDWHRYAITPYSVVKTAALWATCFFAGFVVGYETSQAITWTTDKAIDYLERAQLAYTDSMKSEMSLMGET